jgi:hypothetical protein
MAKTKLTLSDRFALTAILPAEGSFTELIAIEDLKEKVSIIQKELDKYEIQSLPNGAIGWSQEKTKGVAFSYDFTDREKEIVKKSLEALDADSKLNASHLNLYKEFVK